MDERKISSDKNTNSSKQKKIVIMLEQKLGVIERQERGRSNSKIWRRGNKRKM
jgi:hypothetical protein